MNFLSMPVLSFNFKITSLLVFRIVFYNIGVSTIEIIIVFEIFI